MRDMSNTRKQIAARLGMAAHPGAKAKMGRAEQVMRDGTVHLDFRAAKEWLAGVTDSALRYIINDAQQAAKAMPDGNKWNYYHDLSLTAQDELQRRKRKSARPGAKAKMAAAPGVPELERLYAKFQESTRLFTPNKYRDAGEQKRMTSGQKKDFAFFENLLKAARSGDGKRAKALLAKTDSLLTAHFVPKELRVWAAQFAAHGAKATFADASVMAAFLRLLDYAGTAVARKNYAVAQDFYDQAAKMITAHPDLNRAGSSTRERLMDIGERIKKSRASRPGAKATAAKTTMAAPTPHKVTIVDKTGTERSYMVSDRVLRSIEGTKKQAEARGNKPAYDDVIRLGTKMGEVMEAAKPSDLEREDVKAGLKLMAASDEAVSNKIRTLIAEGKPQDQAVAIALDMKRRGEI